jgi:glycosyltransferase involved in cell wall biosynthesis
MIVESPGSSADSGRPERRPRPVSPELLLPGLSVVLPCLDEAPNITQAVGEALAAGERCALAVEVIVVDDGSRDGTRFAAELIASLDPRVRVVAHAENRGYGAAVRSGIDASQMPWVLLTDADLQFDLAELETMLPLAACNDIVAGFRILRRDPLHRRAAAAAWNLFVRRSFVIGVRDVDCAFKLVRGPALRALPLRSEGAMISTELYAYARREGWRLAEAGVHHRPRLAGSASGANPAVVLRAFGEHRALAHAMRAGARETSAARPARSDQRSGALGA